MKLWYVENANEMVWSDHGKPKKGFKEDGSFSWAQISAEVWAEIKRMKEGKEDSKQMVQHMKSYDEGRNIHCSKEGKMIHLIKWWAMRE